MLATTILVSCKNTKTEECIYKLANSPSDTIFYVSYELDGVPYKYYQLGYAGHAGLTGSTRIAVDGDKTISNCRSAYEFDNLPSEATENTRKQSAVYLVFQNIQTIEKGNAIKPLYELDLWNYAFTYASPSEMSILDTAYMTGVALNIVISDSTSYSTQHIMEFFDYDYPTILGSVLNPDDNFLNIVNIEEVCIGNYIVEGTLSTTISNKVIKPEDPDETAPDETVELTYLKVTNGKFKFLTQ
jgi:hypothetical protein